MRVAWADQGLHVVARVVRAVRVAQVLLARVASPALRREATDQTVVTAPVVVPAVLVVPVE